MQGYRVSMARDNECPSSVQKVMKKNAALRAQLLQKENPAKRATTSEESKPKLPGTQLQSLKTVSNKVPHVCCIRA